jgi:hypothetical protein
MLGRVGIIVLASANVIMSSVHKSTCPAGGVFGMNGSDFRGFDLG